MIDRQMLVVEELWLSVSDWKSITGRQKLHHIHELHWISESKRCAKNIYLEYIMETCQENVKPPRKIYLENATSISKGIFPICVLSTTKMS